MSLYGAMMTGVAGLSAFSNALSVSAANISNVNTVGYKTATSNFATLLASATSNSDPSSAGVVARAGQNVVQQGLMQTTNSPTDLAISGSGFFVVSQTPSASGTKEYTRAGSFTTDESGFLKNTAGLYLMGWQLDSNGNVPSDRNDMTPINVNSLTGKAEASTKMQLQANLKSSTAAIALYAPGDMADGTATPAFQRTINVYDSQGGSQPLQLSFVKTGANTWAYEVTYQGAAANLDAGGGTPPAHNLLASGTVTFNSDGSLADVVPTGGGAAPATGSVSVDIPWSASSGLAAQTISINMGKVNGTDGITQYDNSSTMVSSTVDGALFGSLSGISVDANGIVTAQFSNGLSQAVYKIPLATFSNPNGLSEASGNAYLTSVASGSPTITEADLGGAGTIQSKTLEGSTVDLASEFTNLITTQRAYSASAKIITTASSMLDDLLQMAR
ncbi:MAG TPA: flagellar hook protein FlgE [Rhizomicrobium sp.]